MMALHLLAVAFGRPTIEFNLQLFVRSERFVRQVDFLGDPWCTYGFSPCVFLTLMSDRPLTCKISDFSCAHHFFHNLPGCCISYVIIIVSQNFIASHL